MLNATILTAKNYLFKKVHLVRSLPSMLVARLFRSSLTKQYCDLKDEVKVYYGCGVIRQRGYLNVDVRWTEAVDIIADLEWCATRLQGLCSEVYLSHVLEHYSSPGKEMRQGKGTVLGALKAINRLLKPGGIVRLAVPDFRAIVGIYLGGTVPLYPKLVGRICGEQDYRQNLHKCVFDRDFMEYCLTETGFSRIEEWDPGGIELYRDGSSDEVLGIRTSLNLIAVKK